MGISCTLWLPRGCYCMWSRCLQECTNNLEQEPREYSRHSRESTLCKTAVVTVQPIKIFWIFTPLGRCFYFYTLQFITFQNLVLTLSHFNRINVNSVALKLGIAEHHSGQLEKSYDISYKVQRRLSESSSLEDFMGCIVEYNYLDFVII